jgi:hypothetical protein
VTLDKLSFNQDSGDFEAVMTENAQTFQLTLFDFNEEQSDQAEKLASSICDWLNLNHHAVKDFCASKLTRLKNTSWLEDDDEPVSEQDFILKMELDAINAYSEGSFDIFFNDNDLFLGHSIIVNVNSDFTLENAEIAG